jgi:DNA repair protein RadA/Sms
MAKPKTQFACSECGGISPKWQGQCPHCSAWNTLQEAAAELRAISPRFEALAGVTGKIVSLGNVEISELPRTSTGNSEFDRVLGGGLVPGGVALIGGDPGIGKSTLLLQVAATLANSMKVLYVTGEESAAQVAMRAQRLKVPAAQLRLLPEIRYETIAAAIETESPSLVVIDSIQTLFTDALSAAPGSVSQVRECAALLTRQAKTRGCSVLIVGHVTKDGSIAGPRVLEHIVDTVLYFEGDTHSNFRILRAIKNRFGAANEIGVLAMTDTGLREVSNPSALFLPRHAAPVPGNAVVATIEGTRPLLLEVQALVDSAQGGSARRTTQGFESNRLVMLLAVIHRHLGVQIGGQDVFVNVVGGMKITDPGADAAIALAVISSFTNRALHAKSVVIGEIGLGGEIRPVQRGQDRVREAIKLGYETIVVPKANVPKDASANATIIPVTRLEEIYAWARDSA